MSAFKWRQFADEVILWAVRWYCKYAARTYGHASGST